MGGICQGKPEPEALNADDIQVDRREAGDLTQVVVLDSASLGAVQHPSIIPTSAKGSTGFCWRPTLPLCFEESETMLVRPLVFATCLAFSAEDAQHWKRGCARRG